MATEADPQLARDGHLTGPFVDAVRHVFATMLRAPVAVRPPAPPGVGLPPCYASAAVNFSGSVAGVVVVRFPAQTAVRAVAAAFGGVAVEPGTADFVDGVGEIANLIVGAASGSLGRDARISCPSVIMGHGHVVIRPREAPCTSLVCDSGLGPFALDVSVRRTAR